MKVCKAKIWDDSFLEFSVGFIVVYSIFSDIEIGFELVNYFTTELPVLGQKKVAEHRLITRFPELS